MDAHSIAEVTTARGLPLRIRPMIMADLDAVMAIERRAHSFPWRPRHFTDCLKAGYLAVVAEAGESGIVAYAVLAGAAREADLLNLAVVPERQRSGIARSLLNVVIARIHESVDTLFLEVRESNQAAITLYESLDFNQVGRRPSYYPAHKGREDALILARTLD